MRKDSKLPKALSTIVIIGCLLFYAWETFLTGLSISEPGWQKSFLYIVLLLLLVLFITPCKWLILSLLFVIYEIGVLLGGWASGYTFSSFQFGRYRLLKVKGHLILKKYPMSHFPQCLMKPPESEPEKCPYRLYILGGVILLHFVFIAGYTVFILLQRHVFAYTFAFLPALFSLFLIFMLTWPFKSASFVSPAHLAFYAIPRNPSLRSAHHYVSRILPALFESDSISEIPVSLLEKVLRHDYSLLDYGHVALLYEIKSIIHAYRGEDDEEKLCYETMYNSPVAGSSVKTTAKMGLLFLELIGECRHEEIEKYFDSSVTTYFKKHKRNPSTKRILYAFRLLYENNPSAAQKEFDDFKKIIAVYPDLIDVNSEWDAIRKIQRRKLWKDSGRTYITS